MIVTQPNYQMISHRHNALIFYFHEVYIHIYIYLFFTHLLFVVIIVVIGDIFHSIEDQAASYGTLGHVIFKVKYTEC